MPRSILPDLADDWRQIGRKQTYRAVIGHPLVAPGYDARGSIQIPDIKGIRALAAQLFPTDGSKPPSKYAAPPASSGGGGSGVSQLRRGQAEADPEAHAQADAEAHREALAQQGTHAVARRDRGEPRAELTDQRVTDGRAGRPAAGRGPPAADRPRRCLLCGDGVLAQRLGEDRLQLIPLDQERVVALRRVELSIRRSRPRPRRAASTSCPDLGRPVEDVALDAEPGDARCRPPRAARRPPRSRRGPGPMSWRSIAPARIRYVSPSNRSTSLAPWWSR